MLGWTGGDLTPECGGIHSFPGLCVVQHQHCCADKEEESRGEVGEDPAGQDVVDAVQLWGGVEPQLYKCDVRYQKKGVVNEMKAAKLLYSSEKSNLIDPGSL